nr:M50 family metallopeptidase [Corynebacterium mendelii]
MFALGICVTIALHEWGHYTVARWCGMRVRRYFIGFGPTVWSFEKGHTTYGLKAIPLGGFCDIAGMTAVDELTEQEKPVAMYKKPAWQRVAVLAGGIAMNFLVGIVLLYVVAVGSGLPDPDADITATVEQTSCPAPSQLPDGTLTTCSGPGPAAEAGIIPGDRIIEVNGQQVRYFGELAERIRELPGQTADLTVERGENTLHIDVAVASVERLVKNSSGELESTTVGAIGVRSEIPDIWRQFGPLEAIPATGSFAGNMFVQTIHGLAGFPEKIPGVAKSIIGGERDNESPMSVVGATRVGGELAQRSQWASFLLMLASLNFFLGLFNVVPLPPLDGGHIAVVIYEKIRDFFRRLRGKQPGGPADYMKLVPLTVAVTAVLVVVGVLIIIADIVNPITLG